MSRSKNKKAPAKPVSAAEAVLAKKVGGDGKAAPAKKADKPKSNVLTDEQIISKAGQWAKLHEDPKTRDKMDGVIAGLSQADARRVILCGQRIRAGLKPRIAA